MPAKLTDEGSLVPRPARRRRPHTTAALAATYPLRCFAPQWARFDNRHSISAPAPILSLHQRQRRRDSFAPRRERFLCLRRPHFFQQRKKWGKERRQKLRFCTSSARYTALVCKAAPPRNRHFLTRCRSADCASTAFRCRCPLLRQKLFVLPRRRLRNNYTPCPTGTPTFADVRRQRRDLIIATRPAHQPLPSLHQRQRRRRHKRSPEPTTIPAVPIPRDQHRQIRTCPPRAKGSLDRRSKRLSFPHFFLRRKKCGRRRLAPAGATPAHSRARKS